jgi:Flp pilus assembly protein TadD
MAAAKSESAVPLSRSTEQALRYAEGYLALGLLGEAADELAVIAVREKSRPAVLALRLELVMAQREWGRAVPVARELTARDPANAGAWIHLGYALRRTEGEGLVAARDALAQAVERHGVAHAIVHYNLACYLTQLGELEAARVRLARSFELDAGCRELAQTDDDLGPLRECGWV